MEILSSDLEKKLSYVQLEEYCIKLKAYLKESPYDSYSDFQIKIREVLNRLIFKRLLKIIRKYDLIVDGYESIPSSPVIYAFHHAGIVDAENVVECSPEHVMLLAGGDDLDDISRFLLDLNGTIFVDRSNKIDRNHSKIELMKSLSKGKSILVFPEATWNMSPNKLHLPLTWGILDIAKKMSVPVVPVAQEYIYDESKLDGVERIKKVHIRYGTPIYVGLDDDLSEKLEELSEKFSSVRWSIWEENGIYKRNEISPMLYKNFIACKINSFPSLDLEYEYGCIFSGKDEFYEFNNLNIVDCDEDGTLLQTKHVRRLNEITNNMICCNICTRTGIEIE